MSDLGLEVFVSGSGLSCHDKSLVRMAYSPYGMKPCWRCGLVRHVDEFSSFSGSADGLSVACRDCESEKYMANRDSILSKRRAHYIKNSERIRSRVKSYILDNPEKRSAHTAIERAVKFGRMERPRLCSSCGDPCTPVAHHEDYSRPLDVEWLCVKCHTRLHARSG
jgi:hypothetical protein